jgi:hypothetical protein
MVMQSKTEFLHLRLFLYDIPPWIAIYLYISLVVWLFLSPRDLLHSEFTTVSPPRGLIHREPCLSLKTIQITQLHYQALIDSNSIKRATFELKTLFTYYAVLLSHFAAVERESILYLDANRYFA